MALNKIVERFWKLVRQDRLPKLIDFAQNMLSMFGTGFLP